MIVISTLPKVWLNSQVATKCEGERPSDAAHNGWQRKAAAFDIEEGQMPDGDQHGEDRRGD